MHLQISLTEPYVRFGDLYTAPVDINDCQSGANVCRIEEPSIRSVQDIDLEAPD